jgi:aminoglycoside phosphotransferase (APT) family kinase protein
MIQIPPTDAALEQLPLLFDEAAMAALLSSHVAPEQGVEIVSAHPCYVRYKPETSCLVRYDLTLRQPGGEQTQAIAYLKIFADDRGAARARRSKMRRLSQRAAKLHPETALAHVTYIPHLLGLLQIYPVDYDLPFLVKATSALAMRKALRKSGASREITISADPELIRYKPERKALLRYDVADGPVPRLYGKVHGDDRSGALASWTPTLIDAGVATPPVLVSLPESGFMAHAEAPGTPLSALRGQDTYVEWMEPLESALHQLQATALPSAPLHALATEATTIMTTTHWLARIVPHLAPRLRNLGEMIASQLTALDDVVTTVHGDFYDDQALVYGTDITLIDLDELRRAHPLLDIGNMLAHLTAGELATAREAFRDAVLQRGTYREAELDLFEAAALLRLAPGPFRNLQEMWPEQIDRLFNLAGERLRWTGHRSPASRNTVTDPALPQLATLQDPVAMALRLPNARKKRLRINVVRHKPGRRAILRYELSGGESFFGKTFASARGPKVHEITRDITAAQAFGPGVSLPDPVAYLDDIKLLLLRTVPGTPVEASLRRGDIAMAREIAAALHRFHASGLDLGRRHDLARELSPLPMRIEQVQEHCPALGMLAKSCLSGLHSLDAGTLPWRDQPVHRDFYHDQILTHEGTLAVLDLDDATMSEPTIDVANFAAHLTLLAAQHPEDATPLSEAEGTFVAHYRSLDPDSNERLYRFLYAATLVRLAGIHISRPHGPEVVRPILDIAITTLAALTPR